MESVVVLPQLASHGRRDLARAIALGLVAAAGVFGVPLLASLTVYARTDNLVFTFAVWMVFYALILLASGVTVHWLRLDAEGITFGRRWGGPKYLPWAEVRRIRPAPPREVIVRGWLLPPIPAREGTRSMTAVGHYAVEYGAGKVAYYPPVDEPRFLAAIREWCPGALD
ncbi:MAG TPA: hypothetical protein VE913_06715 [Longimicrobium sp.]|nr:hypothetical protein [Longimicrobium sp.]